MVTNVLANEEVRHFFNLTVKECYAQKGNIHNVIKAHRARSPIIGQIHGVRYEQFRASFDPPAAQIPFAIQRYTCNYVVIL